MRHPSEGQLRAYGDDALNAAERARVEQHLATCQRCTRVAVALQARGARVRTWMSSMEAQPPRTPLPASAARRHVDAHLSAQRERTMRNSIFARRYRPAWVAAALIIAIGVSMLFAPVRTLAGNLLSLFRVRQIAFVEVDTTRMPDNETLEEAIRKLEGVMEEQLALQVEGTRRTADAATARSEAGYAVRFPEALGEPEVVLEPGIRAAGQIELARIRALLTELGYADVELPDELDGAEVSIAFGTMVSASYGPCSDDQASKGGLAEGCIEFGQVPAPLLSAPPALDIDRLGSAYLQLLGMSPNEAAQFSSRVNWATTLVIPLPRTTSLGYEDIVVDGVTGTIVRPVPPSTHVDEYLVLWVKNEVVYALHGTGSTEEAIAIANSLH
jgi:hypothetical protein